jgi:hypothetical protein
LNLCEAKGKKVRKTHHLVGLSPDDSRFFI